MPIVPEFVLGMLAASSFLAWYVPRARRAMLLQRDASLVLSTAGVLAASHGHQRVALPHLALALLPDPFVARRLEERGARPKELYDAIEALLPAATRPLPLPVEVEWDTEVIALLDAHALGLPAASPGDLLHALLESTRGEVRATFELHGVTAARWRAPAPPRSAGGATRGVATGPYRAVHEPRQTLDVVLWNDDSTTMEFVVEILRAIFGLREAHAIRLMFTTHLSGKAVARTCEPEGAERLAALARAAAEQRGFPLRVTAEPRATQPSRLAGWWRRAFVVTPRE